MRLSKIANWTLADIALVLQALVVVTTIRLALRVMSLHRLRRVLARSVAACARARLAPVLPGRIAWCVDVASRLGTPSCLARALAAQTLLAARGVDSSIVISVRRGTLGAFEAHATLTHGGRTVLGHLPAATLHTLAQFDRVQP